MRKFLYFFLLLAAQWLYASEEIDADSSNHVVETAKSVPQSRVTRGDVQIIESTENIRYISQKLAKEYLFFYLNPENEKAYKDLHTSLDLLGQNLRAISMVTKDEDTQNILEFLAYSKEEIASLLNKKVNKDTIGVMLEHSETLLEGADAIAKTYAYDYSKEEKMLVMSKNIRFSLERMSKYYMALKLGYDVAVNRENMKHTIASLKSDFIHFETYVYPNELKEVEQRISKLLASNIKIVKSEADYFIPSLLLDSVSFSEDEMDRLSLYHSKNL